MAETLIGIGSLCWNIFLVALGVGFVIFVHELGHFVVAKLCGVKCEKFFLGFDIGGWAIFKFRRGETLYGIGIMPLGGYVKMLGQEDNPAKLQAEIERAKLQPAEGVESETTADERSEQVPEVAAAKEALYDPRSYLAKSVPQRMAIIAAGVIMNVIFAFFMAMWAYGLGVEKPVCGVGAVAPGGPAWKAGLRPGDMIVEIAGKKSKYYEDLRYSVSLGDNDEGIPFVVQRPGVDEPLHFTLQPEQKEIPQIGVQSISALTLAKIPTYFDGEIPPFYPGSAASKAKEPLQGGDRITTINGKRIEDYAQFEAAIVEHTNKDISFMVKTAAKDDGSDSEPGRLVEVSIPPQPIRTLGFVMEMGKITAIQDNSPAKAADIRPNDKIVKIDGNPPKDPMFLPEWFRRREGQTVRLTLLRAKKEIEISVQLRHAPWLEKSLGDKPLISIPQLGIAYEVLNQIARVETGSDAEKGGIKVGENVLAVEIKPPTEEELGGKKIQFGEYIYNKSIPFGEDANWPVFFETLQSIHPLSKVELTFQDNKKVTLALRQSADWFAADRGWLLDMETVLCKADSLGKAVQMGANETGDGLLMVVKFLRKLGARKISPKALGGPGTIFVAAYQTVRKGTATFLLFLTLLSANLAVLNILPIPVLDGGHLVFLAYEGIRGKPANERIQLVLSMIGLFLLLALMIFVISLDVWRWLL